MTQSQGGGWRVRLLAEDGETTVKEYARAGVSREVAEQMADRKGRQYPHLARAGLTFVAEPLDGEEEG